MRNKLNLVWFEPPFIVVLQEKSPHPGTPGDSFFRGLFGFEGSCKGTPFDQTSICDVTSKLVKKRENTCTSQLFSTKTLVFNTGKSYINRKFIKLRKQIHTIQILFLKLWKLTEKKEMGNFDIFYRFAILTQFFLFGNNRGKIIFSISIKYNNVSMEVSFHLQKTRLKMSEANKSYDLSRLHG